MEHASADHEFFRHAVERYANMVVRVAYHTVQNQSDAEDIAQEVFIKLLKQPSFHDDEHMKAWLLTVTINQCRDFKKSFWQRKTEALPEEQHSFNSEQQHSFDNEQQHVLDELWKLSPEYRNVLLD